MQPSARSFLRSSTPLRSWLLPNLRIMDRKMGRPMVGGGVEQAPSVSSIRLPANTRVTSTSAFLWLNGNGLQTWEFPASQAFVEMYDEIAAEKSDAA